MIYPTVTVADRFFWIILRNGSCRLSLSLAQVFLAEVFGNAGTLTYLYFCRREDGVGEEAIATVNLIRQLLFDVGLSYLN